MKVISSIILLFFVAIPIVFGFGGQTKMRIDEIYNNTETNILLKPTNKVEIDYFSGSKALQSTADGELEESSITNTELSYLSGVTSSIQDQIDSKVPLTRNIDTTSPLQGGGTLEADKTLSILQSGTAQDGYLSSTDWNTFNDKQNAITGTDGDLYYWNSGLSSLAIGSEFQVLRVSSLGFPEWVDLPISVSVTTKGDLQTYSTQAARLPVGTDGQVLQANSATSTGLEWVDADFYTSPLTTQGDLLYRNATQDTRLPIGTENQVLTVNASGLPVWSDAQGGGGGSAGINFVPDSSFEKNELLPDVDENGTGSYQTFDDNNKLDSEFNSFYFRSVWQGVTNNDTFIKDTFARTDLDGKQGLFSIWVKANADNFELCLRTDDPNFESACEDAYKLNVIGDNTWRKYEIPFIYGASSVQYDVRNSDYTGSATIEIDNIYIGTMPDGYVSKIDTTITDWKEFTPTWLGSTTNPTIGNGSISGKYRRVGDSAEIWIQVYFGSTTTNGSGTYHWDFSEIGVFDVDKTPPSTLSKLGTGQFYESSDGANNRLGGARRYSPSSVSLYSHGVGNLSSGSTGMGGVADTITLNFTAPIAGWSSEKSTVVTQDTELTAKTANEFSARISSDGAILSENYDWINGNCVYDSVDGSYGCTLNNLNITNPLACTIGESFTNRNVIYSRTTSTTNLVRFIARLSTTDTVSSANFDVHCSKQGTDVNKSQTIIGKFENINSSDLCHVEARLNDGEIITVGTEDIPWKDVVKDNCNAWSNAGNTGSNTNDAFTAPRDMRVMVTYQVFTSTATNGFISYYVNGSQIRAGANGAEQRRQDTIQIDLLKGDVLTFRPANVDLDLSASGVSHWIQITELPDTQSIVKNLSNQKVECQKKRLTAGVYSTGLIPDLQFNNLEVGKKYSIQGKLKCYEVNSTLALKGCEVRLFNGSENVGYSASYIGVNQTNTRLPMVFTPYKFTATDTTLTATAQNLYSTYIYGSGFAEDEYLELCELPDTYVETTKF